MHPLGMPMEFLWRCWRPYCTFIVTLLPFYHMYSKCTARKSILFVSSNLKTTQLHVHPVKMPQSCHSDVRDSIVSILAFCSRGIYIGGGNHQAWFLSLPISIIVYKQHLESSLLHRHHTIPEDDHVKMDCLHWFLGHSRVNWCITVNFWELILIDRKSVV